MVGFGVFADAYLNHDFSLFIWAVYHFKMLEGGEWLIKMFDMPGFELWGFAKSSDFLVLCAGVSDSILGRA